MISSLHKSRTCTLIEHTAYKTTNEEILCRLDLPLGRVCVTEMSNKPTNPPAAVNNGFHNTITYSYKMSIAEGLSTSVGSDDDETLEYRKINFGLHAIVDSFQVPGSETIIVLGRGSVIDFTGSAIVNAANEACLGGGGVDGAITAAGGKALAEARKALPVLDKKRTRCPTGECVVTISGELKAKDYCLHAVGTILLFP